MAVRRGKLHFAQYYAAALTGIFLISLSMMQMRTLQDLEPDAHPVAPWCGLAATVPLTLNLYIPKRILSTSTLSYCYWYVFLLAALFAGLTTSRELPAEQTVSYGQLAAALIRIPASTFAPRLSVVVACNVVPTILILAPHHQTSILLVHRSNAIMFELASFTFAVCTWVACQRALTSKAKTDVHCGKIVSESGLKQLKHPLCRCKVSLVLVF